MPNYIQALKERHFSRSGPQNFSPVRNYPEKENIRNPKDLQAEAEKLRGIIDDLQMQIERLEKEDQQTEDIEQQIEAEKQISIDLKNKIENASNVLSNSEDMVKMQTDQVAYFESMLNGKNQIAASKESMLMRLHSEYNSLIDDYQRILNTIKNQTQQIRKAGEQIDELNREIEQLENEQENNQYDYSSFPRHSQANVPPAMKDDFDDPPSRPKSSTPPPQPFNYNSPPVHSQANVPHAMRDDFDIPPPSRTSQPSTPQQNFDYRSSPVHSQANVPSAMRDSFDIPTQPNSFLERPPDYERIRNVPSAMKDSFNLSNDNAESHQFYSPTRSETPRAMEDNIHFGEKPSYNRQDIENMSVSEMKDELSRLQKEKEETEKIVNRAPQQGVSPTRSRRIKEENELKLDEIEKRMGKIRLVLKQMHAL